MTELYIRPLSVYDNVDPETALRQLTPDRRERYRTAGNKKRQREILAAGLLLHEALCRRLGQEPRETEAFLCEIGENGKPYLTDPRGNALQFNLSHSGDWVCCAVGEEPVGIDIQKIGPSEQRDREQKIARRCFIESEYEWLQQDGENCAAVGAMECTDPADVMGERFAQLWSAKEAYIKLRARSVVHGMDTFTFRPMPETGRTAFVLENGETTAVIQIPPRDQVPEGYCIAVCTDRQTELVLHQIEGYK